MVLMRNCLEHAMYGVHFHRHPEHIEVWSHRGDGAKKKKAVRKIFKPSELIRGITALNNAIGERANRLYEDTIDMGAHPNEIGFFGRLSIVDLPNGNRQMQVKYLQGGEVAQLNALKTCALIGVCTLESFWLVYRERFIILGVKANIDALKENL